MKLFPGRELLINLHSRSPPEIKPPEPLMLSALCSCVIHYWTFVIQQNVSLAHLWITSAKVIIFGKIAKLTYSTFSQAVWPMCTKMCTQHLWTLLTKSSKKNFDIPKNTQVIKNQLPVDFGHNRECCTSPHLSVRMTWNSDSFFPMSSWCSVLNSVQLDLKGALLL